MEEKTNVASNKLNNDHIMPLELASEDSNGCHDVIFTGNCDEMKTHKIEEQQSIVISNSRYCDVNHLSSMMPHANPPKEVGNCISNEGYVATTEALSLVLTDVVPLDEDHLDSGGYITKQVSFEFNS